MQSKNGTPDPPPLQESLERLQADLAESFWQFTPKDFQRIRVTCEIAAEHIIRRVGAMLAAEAARAERRGARAELEANNRSFMEFINSLEQIVARNDGRDDHQRVEDVRSALEAGRAALDNQEKSDGKS